MVNRQEQLKEELSSVRRTPSKQDGAFSLFPNRKKKWIKACFVSFWLLCMRQKERGECLCKRSLVSGRRRRQHSWASARTLRQRHVYLVVLLRFRAGRWRRHGDTLPFGWGGLSSSVDGHDGVTNKQELGSSPSNQWPRTTDGIHKENPFHQPCPVSFFFS